MLTVNTPSLSQAVIGGILVRNNCRSDANRHHRVLSVQYDHLLTELAQHFPRELRAELAWTGTLPGGGFFVVVTVPFVVDEAALTRSAREYGVL